MTPLTLTEIEELRIAIAEECGWKFKTQQYGDSYWAHHEINTVFDEPPFYTTSLDAIQAACLERFKTVSDLDEFGFELLEIADSRNTNIWQLTPFDWCIAFARTAKIWRYKACPTGNS